MAKKNERERERIVNILDVRKGKEIGVLHLVYIGLQIFYFAAFSKLAFTYSEARGTQKCSSDSFGERVAYRLP